MKKFISILSWASALSITLTISLVSLYVGASVCNYLYDLLGLCGWQGLFLTPVLFIISSAMGVFFVLGLQRFGR